MIVQHGDDIKENVLTHVGELVSIIEDIANKRADHLNVSGVYILETSNSNSPVYVGQTTSFLSRLKKHAKTLLTGDFCYWDPDELQKRPSNERPRGFVKSVPSTQRGSIYEPAGVKSPINSYNFDEACSFLRTLSVWCIRVSNSEMRLEIEGYLIDYFKGAKDATNGYLLANAKKSGSATKATHGKIEEITMSSDAASLPVWWPKYEPV